MKLTKSQLKEFIRQSIIEADDWWKKLSSAEQAQYIKKHPKSQKAQQAKKDKKIGIDKDDVGGPSYSNVPKGTKSSAQAKDMTGDDTTTRSSAEAYARTNNAAEDLGFSSAEDLTMNGSADEIGELMDHDDVYESLPEDLHRPLNNALDFIRDNEMGMNDDDDLADDYRGEILKMIQNPDGWGKKGVQGDETDKKDSVEAKKEKVYQGRKDALDTIKYDGLDVDNMQDTFEKIKDYADWMGYEDEIEDFEMELEDIIADEDVDTFKSYAEELLDPDKKEKDMGKTLAQMDYDDEDSPESYYDDEYSSNLDGQGNLPLSKSDREDPEVAANLKKRNTSTPDHPSEDDFFKHHADKLNKQADAGNSAMVDTEYHGAVAVDYVDREERRIIGSDEDGEQIELDYGDVVRFWNPDTDLKESKQRRYTVKEVHKWMKTLEENRYKKVYNADARRVSWMCNNIGENVANMPKSMRKKWTKAAYGRERYLAKEFLKSKQKMVENKLRKHIRKILIERYYFNEDYKSGMDVEVPTKDMGKVRKVLQKLKLKPNKDYNIGVGGAFGSGKTFVLKLSKKIDDKVIELLAKNRIKIRG